MKNAGISKSNSFLKNSVVARRALWFLSATWQLCQRKQNSVHDIDVGPSCGAPCRFDKLKEDDIFWVTFNSI